MEILVYLCIRFTLWIFILVNGHNDSILVRI
mgnify:CR=1 FL=1